ncbi:MAG: hypothetical protein HPY69_00445 [Armatimonadetes bacterium]|nr:hypothetical protein [Armatimonadota bacterium]
MLRCIAVTALALVVGVAAAQQSPPVAPVIREGNLERLILDDGLDTDAAQWRPAEARVSISTKQARRGPTSLQFHVEVDWSTGEPQYPIGWPRMQRSFPEPVRDWSGWDYLEFSIYVESSRDKLPATPMGVGLYGAGSRADYSRSLTELQLGKWTDYRLPLADLPGVNPRSGIQFHISESNYRDGDELDFWIDNICLVRYVEPTLAASRLVEQAIYADSRYLLVDLDLMGVKQEAKAEVTWALSRNGTVAAEGRLDMGPGRSRVALPLPSAGLAAGEYELALRCRGDSPAPFALKVARSPWQEGTQ